MKITTLQPLVAEWARRNFPEAKPHQPLLGVIEEVGELAHAHLKSEQGIRTGEDHRAKKMDAAADAVIFLCHYCALAGERMADIPARPITAAEIESPHKIIGALAAHAGQMSIGHHIEGFAGYAAQTFVAIMARYCLASGFTLEDSLETTWAEVSKRDWQKNKENGKV